MARSRKSRKLSLHRLLQVALPLSLLLGALFVALQFLWLQSAGWGTPHKSYEEFEQDVREEKVRRAVVDGNIIKAEYDGTLLAVVITPSIDRSVEIMLKKGVRVEAARAVPASGLSLPVLALALLPYPILAYFVYGLVQSVGTGAEFAETEALVRKGGETAPAEQPSTLPAALDDSIEEDE